MVKNWLKILFTSLLLIAFVVGLNFGFMSIYVKNKFKKLIPLVEPSYVTPYQESSFPERLLVFLHKVNTPIRANRQQYNYDGFEIDISADASSRLWVAHDETDFGAKVELKDIFSSISEPQNKYYWLDIKSDLTNLQVEGILQTAQLYNISPSHLYFEVPAGETAQLLSQKGLLIFLQILEGFADDKDALEREKINTELEMLWDKYKPAAIVGSFGKYATLQAYFPTMPKAIYYSSTVRPSFKKYFMKKEFVKDPSVKIFLMEAYTFL